MDWTEAIERNRDALKRILAALVAMAGLGEATLPRHIHRAVLRLLRPAEAATRRLVIALARDLPAPPQARKAGSMALPPQHPRKPKPKPAILRNGVGTGILMPPGLPLPGVPAQAGSPHPAPRALSLSLLDPLRHPFRRRSIPQGSAGVPRICLPGVSEPFPVAVRPPLSPNDPIGAERLHDRLRALGRALDDLPAQAKRFARWRDAAGAQFGQPRDAAGAPRGEPCDPGRIRFRRLSPLRPGPPPGWNPRAAHEIHDVLKAAHWLAFQALECPDTS